MAASPDFFEMMRNQVRGLVHDLANDVGVLTSNARFLSEASLRGLTPDQASAIRENADASDRAAAVLRKLQAILM